MTIQQNIAEVMQMLKEQRNLSLAEFSEELEISRSTLQEYLTGNGNPNMLMLEHIAAKLQIDPILLITGAEEPHRREMILLMFQTTQAIVALPDGKRKLFAELFIKIVSLLDPEESEE